MLTVKAPTNLHHHRGVLLQSAKDRMDIVSAHHKIGSYQAAAAAGRSVPKTRCGGRPGLRTRGENQTAGFRPSGCCPKPETPATRVLTLAFGRRSRKQKHCGAVLITVGGARGMGNGRLSGGRLGPSRTGLFLFGAVLAFPQWRFARFATNERASPHAAVNRTGRQQWCPIQSAGRPDGLPPGRSGRRRRHRGRGLRPIGRPLRTSARLMPP